MSTSATTVALQDALPYRSFRRSKSRTGIRAWITLPLFLWGLLWLSINTGPWTLYDFGDGLKASMNAARAAFPLVACAIALVFLVATGRRRSRTWGEKGFWVYAIAMLIASTGAENWFGQAYWAFAFIGALAVVDRGLRSEDPLEFARRLNWLSWATTALVLVVMLVLARDVLYAAGTNSAYGIVNRFQAAHGYLIPRATGLSRMAAVPAIISLVLLFHGRMWRRALSLAVFAGSVYVIWIMQSRGALFSFLGAFVFVLFFGQHKVQKIFAVFVGALLAFTLFGTFSQGEIHELWLHVTRGEGLEGFSNMSGRNFIWSQALQAWADSPLLGYGPQADRLFGFNGQNAVLYALLCGGLVGATSFVIAMVAAWRALIRLTLRARRIPRQERSMFQIAGAVLVFSTLRSIPENNAAVFSIDLLLQYPAMIYLIVLRSSIWRRSGASAAAGGYRDIAFA